MGEAFWAFWVTLGPPFGGLGVALGVHFGGQGVPLGAFGVQAVPRTAPLFYATSMLNDVGAQRVLKGLQHGAKIVENRFKHLSTFCSEF